MNRLSNNSRVFFFILLLAASCFANPPAPDSVRQIISASGLEWEKFEDESFMLRMQFDLSGRLLTDSDKSFFCGLASDARDQLDRYSNEQQLMLKQIEDYEGADWEQKYGSSGLWRRLAAAVEATRLNRAQADYLYSVICENSQPSDIVRQRLFKRKLRSDLGLCEVLKVAIEQMEYFGPSGPNEINDVAQSLAKSDCKDDQEMLLPLAILQHKYAPDELQNTLSQSPRTAVLLGKLLLAEFSTRFSQSPADVNFESTSPVDAELAAVAALQTDIKLYTDLITSLAENNRFQTPAVLYAAAMLYQDTMPKKAVELLIKAGDCQLQQRDDLLAVTPQQIAEKAFNLAYYTFTQDTNNCQPAVDAYENYSQIAPGEIDELTQYLYGTLLYNCNKISDAAEVFRKLENQSQSIWRDAATLELIKIELNKEAASPVLDRLHDFILACTRPEEREIRIRREAMNLYCQVLLARDSNEAAERVLDILDTAEPTPGLPYEFYRAQVLKQLGRLEESAYFLVQAVDFNETSAVPLAVSLLSEILDKVELWQQNARDFNEMLTNCADLAQFAHQSQNNRKTLHILAEFSVIRKKDCSEPISSPDENDVMSLRLMSRIAMAKGDFESAAHLWAKIAEIRRNDTSELNRKSWDWWRAKFYELDCFAKSPDADNQSIAHTIEVLQNTYTNIPLFWAQKFETLKVQLLDRR